MKVIFVASGNKKGGSNVSAFVQSQYDSLKKEGLEMRLVGTEGKGAKAYLRTAWKLRKMIREFRPDVVHAHYSVCGYVAALACIGLRHKPQIVVSILGSFPKRNRKWRLVRFCIQHVWDKTLVKSERTKKQLGLDLLIIPNGVNLDIFRSMDYAESRKEVGFDDKRKYIIWCSNPERPEKNWKLAVDGVRELESEGVRAELVAVYNKTPEEVCTYMNAADCLLLTSWSEGSPNVIKEAMACNCPIVTVEVGDVTERLDGLDGCYVAPGCWDERVCELGSERVRELGKYIGKALAFGKRTEGRKRIVADGLTIELTAQKIIKLYNE